MIHLRCLQPLWQSQAKTFEQEGLRVLRTYHATYARFVLVTS